MEQIGEYLYKAETGKVFKRISTNQIYNDLIVLPKSINITEFEEVDKPIINEEKVE